MPDRVYFVDLRYFEEANAAFGRERLFLATVPCTALPEPLACHPDMVLFPATPGFAVCAPEVFTAYNRILMPLSVELLQGSRSLGRDYPADVAYNVLYTDSGAFARWNSTDPLLAQLLDECGIPRFDTAQGYARCSALAFADCLITADPSLAAAGTAAGLSVLTITPGHIALPGYDYGFIGGASGVLGDTIAFFGDLDTHPDGGKIRNFIKKQGFRTAEIAGRPLCDIGTILCIEL